MITKKNPFLLLLCLFNTVFLHAAIERVSANYHNCNPETVRSRVELIAIVNSLAKQLGANFSSEPTTTVTKVGLTVIQPLGPAVGHVALYTFNSDNKITVDVLCSMYPDEIDIKKIFKAIKDILSATSCTIQKM